MTIEEIFGNFADKYQNFNWWMILGSESIAHFVPELKKEIGQDNPIFQYPVYDVAKCLANDDVLFLIADGSKEGLWRIYHLTYTENNIIGFPQYQEFTDRKSVGDFIEKQFIADFL